MNADQRRCCLLLALLICVHPRASALIFAAEVRGVSLAHLHRGNIGYGSEDCRKQLQAIAALGANWVAISEFAHMPAVNEPRISFNRGRQTVEQDLSKAIADAHAAGLKVMLKPHLWSRQFYGEGKWAGDIAMKSDAEWETWFAQYTQFVVQQAKLAEATGAEALSVGVELKGTTVDQEARWRKLIAEVRKVYKGHLTYSSAFWEATELKFWDALDCIGIDAYYPIARRELADEHELRAGWAKVYESLGPLSKKWNKPICFTELGYTASPRAGIEPWSWDVEKPDPEYQARLYRVALDEAGKRDFLVGVFVWKWFTSDRWMTIERNEQFSIQDSEQVLKVLRGAWKP